MALIAIFADVAIPHGSAAQAKPLTPVCLRGLDARYSDCGLSRLLQRCAPFIVQFGDGLARVILEEIVAVLALAHGGVELLDELLVVFLGHVVQKSGGDAVAAVVM